MLLPVALFGLFTIGFCLPCLLDVASTPRCQIRSLSKGTWLLLVSVFWVFGAAAWLLVGRPGARLQLIRRDAAWLASPGPAEAFRWHPARRAMELGYGPAADETARRDPDASSRPQGPDDDPEFLLALERQIRHEREDREDW